MTSEQWAARFDARYGADAYARLCAQFEQPRYTYSSIAAQFGVTRERVRQWHRLLNPHAPAGRERRRLYLRQREWRDLLQEGLFRAFYQHARQHAPGAPVRPVPTSHGFSRAAALLDGRRVSLRRATPRSRRQRRSQAFRITTPPAPAEFVYVLLADDAFFLLPCSVLPRCGTAFQDSPGSKYLRFKNTFDGLHFVPTDETDPQADAQNADADLSIHRPGGE